MKISRSAEYALIAVGYIAENRKNGPVLTSRISKEYNITPDYLPKILQQLVRAGILKSKRGLHGGFFLARNPDDITLLEIVEAVDGSLRDHPRLSVLTKDAPFSVKMEAVCRNASEYARAIYEKSTLSSFIET
ncbi:MAG TPA: Rrf2 family transcriptional regulator [Planctomycetes bacterium]|nr:Rrf2 family transcriptional regulator [Planctomycetota bacterium]